MKREVSFTRRSPQMILSLAVFLVIASSGLALATENDLELKNRRGQLRVPTEPARASLVNLDEGIIIGPVPGGLAPSRIPQERGKALGRAQQTPRGPFLKLWLRRHLLTPGR